MDAGHAIVACGAQRGGERFVAGCKAVVGGDDQGRSAFEGIHFSQDIPSCGVDKRLMGEALWSAAAQRPGDPIRLSAVPPGCDGCYRDRSGDHRADAAVCGRFAGEALRS
jgi:hypothetical protein